MTTDFNRLYREYYQSVCKYFRKRYKEAEAEDLAQETFLRLWAWAGYADSVRNEKALVFSIAKSVLCDRLRRNDAMNQYIQIDELFETPSSQSFEKSFELSQILATLSEEERMVIEMKNMGYKSSEIGKKLGISASAARTRLQQVRNKLKNITDI